MFSYLYKHIIMSMRYVKVYKKFSHKPPVEVSNLLSVLDSLIVTSLLKHLFTTFLCYLKIFNIRLEESRNTFKVPDNNFKVHI